MTKGDENKLRIDPCQSATQAQKNCHGRRCDRGLLNEWFFSKEAILTEEA